MQREALLIGNSDGIGLATTRRLLEQMAKAPHRPFMITVERAADHVLDCIARKPIRHTAPRSAIPAVRIVTWSRKLRMLLSG